MAGEGQLLRAAREANGWSLAQAEEITKIRIRYLEAMENENYGILPGATYAKGFLRTYAKHLGLNPDDILDLYKSSQPDTEPQYQPAIVMTRKRPIWLRPAVAVITGVIALGVVIGIATLSKPNGQDPAAYTPPALPTTPKTEPPKQTDTNPPAQPQASPQNPPNVVAATTEGLKAQLVFTQPCWLVVNADGQKVLEGTYTSGTTKEITANNKIEFVTVGNAGGISITLNGVNVPSLGASGQVVHNVVFTKDTLTQLSAQAQTQGQAQAKPQAQTQTQPAQGQPQTQR